MRDVATSIKNVCLQHMPQRHLLIWSWHFYDQFGRKILFKSLIDRFKILDLYKGWMNTLYLKHISRTTLCHFWVFARRSEDPPHVQMAWQRRARLAGGPLSLLQLTYFLWGQVMPSHSEKPWKFFCAKSLNYTSKHLAKLEFWKPWFIVHWCDFFWKHEPQKPRPYMIASMYLEFFSIGPTNKFCIPRCL